MTVKGTNTIYVFPVDKNGSAGSHPTITQAPGPALPSFAGCTFDRFGRLLVTEGFGSATSIPKGGAGAVSSFSITADGHLAPISSDVADGGTDALSVVLEPVTKRFAYVANNLSASISSYRAGNNGIVTLLNGTAASGARPNDLATATEGTTSLLVTSFLYVVAAGTGTVGAFKVNTVDGSLTAITGGGALLAGRSAHGLAAY